MEGEKWVWWVGEQGVASTPLFFPYSEDNYTCLTNSEGGLFIRKVKFAAADAGL